ncbi:MAG: hypothetical protein COS36_02730 [Candidatus Altarchaeum sp. CG03_land_8_20_14_0_80_32_618]|nr:MAG: hypothetical protein COS36_02730 [Candidatus Altarchaeum sp. CG03_land_8_20_14_0_80_32_618]PIX48502.1 MAG: hypothetical protein COZ53_03780 [Candidatus Altarchaeum sp. CG_4_8_14_3_um_filter_33_2054]PIZ29318.1 MAG: hypothetical protein COY41_05905 [Candidatus Altarchaeum sp. CG_4_10_14_0_8_um_filter_32_851]
MKISKNTKNQKFTRNFKNEVFEISEQSEVIFKFAENLKRHEQSEWNEANLFSKRNFEILKICRFSILF